MSTLCKCGCGNPVGIAKRTDKRYGTIKGQPLAFLAGHQNSLRKLPEEVARRNRIETQKKWREKNPDLRYKNDPIYRAESLARSAKWAEEHKEERRAYTIAHGRNGKLKRRGWTLESFDKAKQEQKGACAICKTIPSPFLAGNRHNENKTLYEPLCADHEHSDPPKPRALLCINCNVGLGQFKDSPELLRAAADYLEAWA